MKLFIRADNITVGISQLPPISGPIYPLSDQGGHPTPAQDQGTVSHLVLKGTHHRSDGLESNTPLTQILQGLYTCLSIFIKSSNSATCANFHSFSFTLMIDYIG